MKKVYLLILLLSFVPLVYGQNLINTSFEDSDGWSDHSSGNWTEVANDGTWEGSGIYANGSDTYSGTRKIGFNDVGDWLELPSVDNPGTLSFYARLSSNASGTNSLKIQQYNGSGWDDVDEITSTTTTYTLYTIDIDHTGSDVRLRIYRSADNRSHYIDNLTLTEYSNNDSDTEVYDTESQPASANISSLVDAQGEAIDVFEMVIEDQSSGDGLATHVTNIRVKPHTSNTADWTNNIQGVTLNDGSAVTIGSPTITDTYIDIPITSGNLDVADGGSKTVTLAIYLNTSNIDDGGILSFMVDADDHGFTADASGSSFASTFLLGDFNSNDFTIDVDATQFTFNQQPTDVNVDAIMSPAVVIYYTDANGNIDEDENGSGSTVTMSTSGTFSGSATTEVNAASGIATFSNLIFSSEGTNETITAADTDGGEISNLESSTFNITEVPKVIISEVTDPNDVYQARFVELFNLGSSEIDFDSETWYICRQTNGGNWEDKQLTGTIYPNTTYIAANSNDNINDDFGTNFGFMADYDFGGSSGNGDDGYFLYKGGDHSTGTLIDAYGVIDQDGTGEDWEYEDSKAVRKTSVTTPNTTWTASEWDITSANVADCDPGTYSTFITWNGASTTDWGTTSNWVGGSVPGTGNGIRIPITRSTNYPSVSGDATTPSECNNLTIQSSASLTIPAAKALTVNGDLDNDGTFTIESTSSGTGSLKVVGSVSGSFDVERYIAAATWGNGDDGWHFLSSPVSSQAISGDWTPDGLSSNDYDFYAWDEPTHYWLNQKDGGNNITSFTVGEGYIAAYQAESTNSFTGTLNNSDVSGIALTRTESAYDDNDDAGFNLLGNPYPCALDWNDGNWTLTNVAADAKMWSNTSQSYVDIEANDEIPAMNGFMVQLTSGTSGSITIPAASRVHDATAWYKSSDYDKLKLVASVVDGPAAQYSTIRLIEEATTDYDKYYDSRFLPGYAPLFYSLKGNDKLSTYSTPHLSDNMIIPFGFEKNSAAEFAISLDETIEDKTVYITDKKLNITHNLTENGSYFFTSVEEDNPNRFEIHFSAVGVEETVITNPVYAYSNGSVITVLNSENQKGEVSILNITGQVIATTALTGDQKQQISIDAQSGVYVVVINTGNGNFVSEKVIITK
jgi:hypothetical protein